MPADCRCTRPGSTTSPEAWGWRCRPRPRWTTRCCVSGPLCSVSPVSAIHTARPVFAVTGGPARGHPRRPPRNPAPGWPGRPACQASQRRSGEASVHQQGLDCAQRDDRQRRCQPHIGRRRRGRHGAGGLRPLHPEQGWRGHRPGPRLGHGRLQVLERQDAPPSGAGGRRSAVPPWQLSGKKPRPGP